MPLHACNENAESREMHHATRDLNFSITPVHFPKLSLTPEIEKKITNDREDLEIPA
jgi:hypothetical protein